MILTLPLLFFTGTFSPGHLPPPLLVSSASLRLDITEAVEAEISNFDTLFETWVATYRAAEDDAGREAALENRPTADDAVKNLFGLVETEPAGDGAFKALTWIMRAYTSEGMSPSAQALSLLAEHHIESEQLKDVAMNLSRGTADMVPGLLTIAEKSPHHDVQGCATLSAGIILGKDPLTRERGVKLLEKVIADYSDVTHYDGRLVLGKKATGELYVMRNLQVGMTVPEIENEDVDGVVFKLSDYRGKVVLLDFWGDW